jgi:LacI family transcriptional regulator
MHKIAALAGVSIATVSRALNNSGPVKEATRTRILQLAQEYQYKPNPIARSLSTKQTDTIGLILPEMADEFFMDIIRGIDEEAYRAKRFLLVSSFHTQRNIAETLLEFMGSGRVDGVILMAPEGQNGLIDTLRRSRRPIVLLNPPREAEEFVYFRINNFQGAFAIVDHLCGHGYRHIGMITGPRGNIDAEERLNGCREAHRQHDLSFPEAFIIPGDFSARSGYYGFMRLMSQMEKPEAVFAANDMMAMGAYQAAKSLNLRIPQDVALVGFDDIFLSQLLTPRLTTVHVPIAELAGKAVRYLLQMINGEVDPALPYHEELAAGLVIGGSCGCESTAAIMPL